MRTSPRSSTERRPRARPSFVALALLSALLVPAAGLEAAGASPAELRARALAVLDDGRYQKNLPAPEPLSPPKSGETPSRLSEEPGGAGGGGLPAEAAPVSVEEVSVLARVVLWVLLSAAVLLGGLWGVRTLLERRRSLAEAIPPERAAREKPKTPATSATSDDPTGLAAEGHYTEAVHALLLSAIPLVARRFRLPLPPSRTSREVLRALPSEGAAREGFAGLVKTVERSWFGGAPVDREEYVASVECFRAVEGRER